MLDSWTDGAAKTAILDFIESVTTPGESFVPPAERIATFDNDGTLWCEKPHYVQAEFLMYRGSQDSDGRRRASSATPGGPAPAPSDRRRISGAIDRLPELISGVADAAKGITTEEFEGIVREFFDAATHPRFGVPYTALAYRPMIELIELLKERDFHVYICTGGGRDFVRVISEEVYGIARERVIGSAGSLEYRDGDIYRKKGIELPIDDGPGKPVHIWKRTGRKPLFACGNADGDTEMLRIAQFSVLVRHDDDEREYAYNEHAEHVVAEAIVRDWTMVSMRDDWTRVF